MSENYCDSTETVSYVIMKRHWLQDTVSEPTFILNAASDFITRLTKDSK